MEKSSQPSLQDCATFATLDMSKKAYTLTQDRSSLAFGGVGGGVVGGSGVVGGGEKGRNHY